MYDPKYSTTFPRCTLNVPAAFAWCTINAPAAFAWCMNHFVHKVGFSYIGWYGVHPLCIGTRTIVHMEHVKYFFFYNYFFHQQACVHMIKSIISKILSLIPKDNFLFSSVGQGKKIQKTSYFFKTIRRCKGLDSLSLTYDNGINLRNNAATWHLSCLKKIKSI